MSADLCCHTTVCVCVCVAARPSAALPDTVAWQLSRASSGMIWTDTHGSTCRHTSKHFYIQVHKKAHADAHKHKAGPFFEECVKLSFSLHQGHHEERNLAFSLPIENTFLLLFSSCLFQ